MSEPLKSSSGDEICPMCKREKSKHTNKEMLSVLKNCKNSARKSQAGQA